MDFLHNSILIKYKRHIKCMFALITQNLKVKGGGGNAVHWDRTTYFRKCKIKFEGNNNRVSFGSNSSINYVSVLIQGDNNEVTIGNNVNINGNKLHPTIINALEGHKIFIGDNCLLSNNIEIHTSDYHRINDGAGRRINVAGDVIIGKHAWIGLRSVILKCTRIPENTVIGCGTIVTGAFEQENTLICGVPGKVLKKDIHWDLFFNND